MKPLDRRVFARGDMVRYKNVWMGDKMRVVKVGKRTVTCVWNEGMKVIERAIQKPELVLFLP